MSRRLIRAVALMVVVLGCASVASAADTAPAIEERFADVNGVRLHYLAAGQGEPIILLHGYAQTSRMWRPLIVELAKTNSVIAPDLRGFGQSSKPDGGYEKKAMAQDVHALAESLGHRRVKIVGHDIGLMVAYAYAAQYPAGVERIALMDAFLPGVGEWQNVWLLQDLWHFHFYGETPLKLVAGRERTYFEHFWNDFAADPKHSVAESDRQFYADQYAQPGAMRAGFEVFRAFPQDARDFAEFANKSLQMPMLVLTGEKASGEFLIRQGRMVATDVQGVVVKGSGHWLIDEAPDQVIPRLVTFLTLAPTRLAPPDIAQLATGGAGAGTSGVSGIETTVLSGDPKSPGLYTLRLTVPPNTRIESHRHRDNRSATVVSGTWRIGFGPRFDEKRLKPLPPGSFYTEPADVDHFAQTAAEPVVVYITGYGPTDTTYTDPPAEVQAR